MLELSDSEHKINMCKGINLNLKDGRNTDHETCPHPSETTK